MKGAEGSGFRSGGKDDNTCGDRSGAYPYNAINALAKIACRVETLIVVCKPGVSRGMAFLHDASQPMLAAAPPAATDHKAVAADLLAAANESAKGLKALFFWYIAAISYAVISVASVTDVQLLRGSPLKLPILNVDIPLSGYFIFLPLVVTAVHVEVLTQFSLLSNKVHDLAASLRSLEQEGKGDVAADFRLRLENFLLLHFLAGNHRTTLRCLLLLILVLLLAMFPLFTLLLIQVQFNSFGRHAIEHWHLALIIIDGCLLLYFWPSFFESSHLPIKSLGKLLLLDVLPRALLCIVGVLILFAIGTMAGLGLYTILWLIGATSLGLTVAGIALQDSIEMTVVKPPAPSPGSKLKRAFQFMINAGGGGPTAQIDSANKPGLVPIAVAILCSSLLFQHFIGSAGDLNWSVTVRDACSSGVFRPDSPITFLLRPFVATIAPTSAKLEPDPDLSEADSACEDALTERLPPVSAPAGEQEDDDHESVQLIDLVLAALGQSRAINAPGAFLIRNDYKPELAASLRTEDAKLVSAVEPLDLSELNFDDAVFDGSVLHKVNFARSSLRRAHLSGAYMMGANLTEAHLEQAQLELSVLVGAILQKVHMRGAALSGASLNNVALYDSDLSGSTLANTDFSSATGGQTTLLGANFAFTDLRKADLTDTRITGATFEGASLRDTVLRQARIIGANFNAAVMTGTDLGGASTLDPDHGDMGSSSFRGTILDTVDFRGADFSAANLDGAILVNPTIGTRAENDAGAQHSDTSPRPAIPQPNVDTPSKTTRWPSSKARCLLAFERNAHPVAAWPKCAYMPRTGAKWFDDVLFAELDGDEKDYLLFNAAPPEFWIDFMAAGLEILCTPFDEPTVVGDPVFGNLEFVTDSLLNNRNDGQMIVDAAVDRLIGISCSGSLLIDVLERRTKAYADASPQSLLEETGIYLYQALQRHFARMLKTAAAP